MVKLLFDTYNNIFIQLMNMSLTIQIFVQVSPYYHSNRTVNSDVETLKHHIPTYIELTYF